MIDEMCKKYEKDITELARRMLEARAPIDFTIEDDFLSDTRLPRKFAPDYADYLEHVAAQVLPSKFHYRVARRINGDDQIFITEVDGGPMSRREP